MKKNIVKTMLKVVATTAMIGAMFIGGNKLEARAMTIEEFAKMVNTPVEEVKADPEWMACYYSGYYDDSLGTYEENVAWINSISDDSTASFKTAVAEVAFDSTRYAADYPDLAAAFGNDRNALYNHYTTNGVKEGRKAYYTDGTPIATAGTSVSRYEMLNLVNADRAANGAAALTWNAELEAHGLERVKVVLANMQSPEFMEAWNNGDPYANIIGHRGHIYRENALLNWSADTATNANARWIESEGHHDTRIDTEYTQYASISYIDPATGEEAWIELFQ